MADFADNGSEVSQLFLEHALAKQAQRNAVQAGSLECDECGEVIPEARRQALPSCRTCVDCQQLLEVRYGSR
ncbi:TraR/DksA family transcriptional regulator [Pseudomonas sp. F1_0610]|uniref:TraR/DksA family transcriptional regulator n=1 Tax=Pseudomonas sp. F1_0610 TaxID=3114284 RepID=UPI0039C4C1DD